MSNTVLMKQAQQIHDLKKELRKSAKRVKMLTEWIERSGEQTNTCTESILGTICKQCRCGKADKNQKPECGQ